MKLSIHYMVAVMLIIIISYQGLSAAYRILAIFPVAVPSHTIVGRALMEGLASAGHNVTFVTPFPNGKVVPNLREIDHSDVLEEFKARFPTFLQLRNVSVWQRHRYILTEASPLLTNITLRSASIGKLLTNPDEQFDVVILTLVFNDALLGIAHHFRAPVIVFSTLTSGKWANDVVGNPTVHSFTPHPFLPYSEKMTFLERLHNVAFNIFETFYMEWHMLPSQRKIYNEYFPDPKPTLDELRANVSLALVNSHFSIIHPKPYVPNMIEIGGINVNRNDQALPDRLQQLLDNATHGAIYFSMGTNVKFSEMPTNVRESIINVLRRLNELVLWKLDVADIPDLSGNIHVGKWFPQPAILAHKNLKLFITHGGLLSLTEAIYNGVPVIGIPIVVDQMMNVKFAEKKGYCVGVDYSTLDELSFGGAIDKVLSDQSYLRQAKLISKRYRDQPMTPLQTAIYWIEYVVRHQGAPHLRSPGQDLNWFSYYSLDVFAVLLACLVLVLVVVKHLMVFILRIIFRNVSTSKLKVN